uniref:Uncharacterized protein n=1 Tax=Pelusios castaneus TaxID=367368 RepID=A0A8C8SMR5_9SAUR
MKVLFVGLATLLCFAGDEALRCNVCRRKLLIFGCVQESGEATCGLRETCVAIKASLGKLPLYYRLNCTALHNCGRMKSAALNSPIFDYYNCCNTDFCN